MTKVTCKIGKSQSIKAEAQPGNWNAVGHPEPPDANQVTDQLAAKAETQIRDMFFYWAESAELHFFHDGDHNIEEAKRGL